MMYSYDLIPYDSYPFYETNPEHLQVLAFLFGLNPTPFTNSKVLEIGCSSGFNIIPLAYRFPQAKFYGIDLGKRQIESGKQFLKELKLENIRLYCASIADLNKNDIILEGLEKGNFRQCFDYIIVHGVLSWVSSEIQEAIFSSISSLLSQNGIAYISYNTYPGWHTRSILRDILQFRRSNLDDSSKQNFFKKNDPDSGDSFQKKEIKDARDTMRVFTKALSNKEQALAIHTREILRNAISLPDWYLFHDLMEENNYPFYLAEIVEKAKSYGLSYLGDADPSVMTDFDLPQDVQKWVRGAASFQSEVDLVVFEQYLDFFKNRMLRRSLFVKETKEINRKDSLEKIECLHATLPVISKVTNNYSSDKLTMDTAIMTYRGVLQTEDPLLHEAFVKLAQAWPNTISVVDLVTLIRSSNTIASGAEHTDRKANLLINIFRAFMQGFVRLRCEPAHSSQTHIAHGHFSKISNLSYLEAKHLSRITTLWHDHLTLTERERSVLLCLDKDRTMSEMMKELELMNDIPVTENQQLDASEIEGIAERICPLLPNIAHSVK